ncbi:hypothetical protein JI721_09125 [Alicyclobacillus cycloheptanicus]|uniref:Uncharacterized protein n=1 Tax=Alicyclobacillus cycloheptanicus TaxID=1457 RepID=A0ABT9XHG7_9BACL|nr:hypothetical protein [Alicyclobacillus cycloheptanicus]MDQ0189632.1 hypothetical protein [Alicyclobacillus cycloheptanicus]WDL99938.1 hypothetical protein JI721_09125 [Alicyclobacillus cycloheptanicus]
MTTVADVQREVRDYFDGIDWNPVIQQNWVEGYLMALDARGKSDELSDAWEDIHALMLYLDRTDYTSISELHGGNTAWRWNRCRAASGSPTRSNSS